MRTGINEPDYRPLPVKYILDDLDTRGIPYTLRGGRFVYGTKGAKPSVDLLRSIDLQRPALAQAVAEIGCRECKICKGVIRGLMIKLYVVEENAHKIYHWECFRKSRLIENAECLYEQDDADFHVYVLDSGLCVCCNQKNAAYPEKVASPTFCPDCWEARGRAEEKKRGAAKCPAPLCD